MNMEFPHTQMFSAHGMKDANDLLFMPNPTVNRVPNPGEIPNPNPNPIPNPNPNLSLTPDMEDNVCLTEDPFNVVDFDPPGPPIRPHVELPHAQIFSAPPSPRQSHNWSALRAATLQRCSSTGPVDLTNTHYSPFLTADQNQPYSLAQSQNYKRTRARTAHSPGFVALKKIRKPSLRTLMSTGGSQGPSPVQSPTLFDQPMQMDDVVEVEAVPLGEWGDVGEGQVDDEGHSGHMLRGSGSEGSGLMTFEGMMLIQD